jgi:hypothetical protein
MITEGYPQFTIFLVLGVGLLLAILRPYKAFLLAVLLLTAGNIAMFNKTRTTFLGPILNLSDACMLVALIAMLFDRLRSNEPVLLPKIIVILFVVVTIAGLQSLWKLGWTYETIRAYRWALQLPLALFLGANLVTSAQRARKLVAVLLCGAVLAALQHIAYVWSAWRTPNLQSYEAVRTISFWGGCMSSAFLVTTVVWKLPANMWKKIAYIIMGILLLTSLLMNQTRSVWLATACSIPCLLVLFKLRNRFVSIMRFGIIAALIVFGMVIVLKFTMPSVRVLDMTLKRVNTLLNDKTRKMETSTREKSFRTEMASWMDGTLIFGRGLYFFQTIKTPRDWKRYIAFGHLGYVTYLSQLGLIGLLAYGVYLPLSIIQDGRWLWSYGGEPIIRYIGLLGTASIICMSIMFIMSSQLLSPGFEAPGILFGAMWALVRHYKTTPVDVSCRGNLFKSNHQINC